MGSEKLSWKRIFKEKKWSEKETFWYFILIRTFFWTIRQTREAKVEMKWWLCQMSMLPDVSTPWCQCSLMSVLPDVSAPWCQCSLVPVLLDASTSFLMVVMVLEPFFSTTIAHVQTLITWQTENLIADLSDLKPTKFTTVKASQVGFWTSNSLWEFYKELPSATKLLKNLQIRNSGGFLLL